MFILNMFIVQIVAMLTLVIINKNDEAGVVKCSQATPVL